MMDTLALVEEFLRRNKASATDAECFANEKKAENAFFKSLVDVRASILAAFDKLETERNSRSDVLLAASTRIVEENIPLFAKALAFDLEHSLKDEFILQDTFSSPQTFSSPRI